MLFAEYRNHRIISLHREIGEPINCFYDPHGLPNKVIYYPIAADLTPGREDLSSDLGIKMRLVAPEGGNKLESYLTDSLGLEKGVDFKRHPNGQRGGLIYFDILTDRTVDALRARAEMIGQRSVAEGVQQRSTTSSGGRSQ